MKHILKLLKDWTDPSGNEFKAGTVVEIEDKALVGEMLADGVAEKTTANSKSEILDQVKALTKEAIDAALKDLPRSQLDKSIHIEVKDRSDDDPTHGFCPEVHGRKHTAGELAHGLGMFAKEVAKAGSPGGQMTERLRKSQARSEEVISKGAKAGLVKAAGDGAEIDNETYGGFLVPTAFSNQLISVADELAFVRPRATKVNLSTLSIELPQLKNYDHSSSNVYGGATAYWDGENDQLTSSRPKLEKIKLNLHPLTTLAYASHQMINFSPVSIGTWLLPTMAAAQAFAEDDAFLNGTGVGQPLGAVPSGAEQSIAIETNQTLANGTIVTANILKMYQALRVERSGAVAWAYNKTDLFYWLSILSIDVGTGGAPVGLVQRMANSPDMMLLGAPLVDCEHCKAAGTVGDIVLGDWSTYLVADHSAGPEVASSIHLKFDYAQTAFRSIKYVDGQPKHSANFTRQNSTNSASSFVTLATRS